VHRDSKRGHSTLRNNTQESPRQVNLPVHSPFQVLQPLFIHIMLAREGHFQDKQLSVGHKESIVSWIVPCDRFVVEAVHQSAKLFSSFEGFQLTFWDDKVLFGEIASNIVTVRNAFPEPDRRDLDHRYQLFLHFFLLSWRTDGAAEETVTETFV